MKYSDRIYGMWSIEEPVILEIIHSPVFQRLKGIDQAGYFDVYYPGTKHSRFEHSMGCLLLLRTFKASLEEQIAGLIHDLSHCAFSHTADYIFAEGSGADHNFQDDIFESFVRTTDIPAILAKYGFDAERIVNEKNFPLQENVLPDICADRIDYSLRGAVIYAGITQDAVDDTLAHLHTKDEQWYFDTYDTAKSYAQMFKMINDNYYSGIETAAMFGRTARWLQYAIDQQYITHSDLFATDNTVISQVNAHIDHDDHLQLLWSTMNDPHIIAASATDPQAYRVVVKSRIIDPLFVEDGVLIRLSDRDHAWGNIVRVDRQPKIYYINDAIMEIKK